LAKTRAALCAGGSTNTEPAPDFKAVEEWLDLALPVLHLHGWVINVSRVPCEADAWAEIDVHSSEKDATLSLSTSFWSQSPTRQRDILAHELVHVLASPVDRLSDSLEDALGRLAFAVYEPNYTQAMEVLTWRVASVIAPLLPLVQRIDATSTSRRRRR
jgi:hypothetical protein